MNEMSDSPAVDTTTLNTLLRGEMSAVEVYTQVMTTFDDEFVISDLQKIRDEHRRSVRELRDQIVRVGLLPSDSSGSSGESISVAKYPTHFISPVTALAVLRQGEEHSINEYEAALENERIHSDCLRVIRAELLPACRKHIEELNRLLGGMGH